MGFFKSKAKHIQFSQQQPAVRQSTQSALDSSSALPNSGFDFIDNSQGASAAVAELSKVLDDGIEDIGVEGDVSDRLKGLMQELDKGASKYSNAHPDRILNLDEWSCTPHEAAIISIAFKCASAVYDPGKWPGLEGYAYEHELYSMPTKTGNSKATTFSIFRQINLSAPHNPHLPLLVVAVRGTADKLDTIVNLNGEKRDAIGFLGSDILTSGQSHTTSTISAHAGFLNGAKALLPEVTNRIKAITEGGLIRHVLFAGHSAGGAVASLLFAKFVFTASSDYSDFRFSLITFGSPPVATQQLTPLLLSDRFSAQRGMVLAVVNAFDLVSRVDTPYVRSLVNLFKVIYNRKPVEGEISGNLPTFSSTAPHIPSVKGTGPENTVSRTWPIPAPDFWPVGKIVLLSHELLKGLGAQNGAETAAIPVGSLQRVLRAYSVAPEDFVRLLFCRVDVHKREVYRKRIDLVNAGKFNGGDGWDMPEL